MRGGHPTLMKMHQGEYARREFLSKVVPFLYIFDSKPLVYLSRILIPLSFPATPFFHFILK